MEGAVPLEEQLYAVASEGAAVLQQQRLVHALLCVVRLALELGVEPGDQEAVGLPFGKHGWVLGDEPERSFVVPGFDPGEHLASLGRFGRIPVLRLEGASALVDVCVGSG